MGRIKEKQHEMKGKISIDSDYVVFPSPPVDIVHILEADACGLVVNKLCPVSLFSVFFLIHSFSTKKKKRVRSFVCTLFLGMQYGQPLIGTVGLDLML